MSGSMSIGRDFEFAGFTALGGLLRNEALFNDIVDHGCWCAKLDPMSESSMLGGSTPIDEMDEICRRWFVARHCNDDLDGGSCRAYKIADNYLLNPAGYDAAGYASACDAANQVAETDIDANGQFDDPWQDAEGNPYNPSTCVHDSCLIDAYYSDLIISYWNDNNATWAKAVIADYDTCLLPEFMDMERTCTGSAPNVVIKNDSSYKSNARGMLPRAPSTDAPAAGGAESNDDSSGSGSESNDDSSGSGSGDGCTHWDWRQDHPPNDGGYYSFSGNNFEFDENGVCQDIDECAIGGDGYNLCTVGDSNGDCQNKLGSWDCICHDGFYHTHDLTPPDHNCLDVDECLTGAHDCTPLETCEN